MRIALFQMTALPGDVESNLALIEDAVIQAAEGGAKLLIAPELATVGYGSGDAITARAETVDGEQLKALAEIAGREGVAVIAGFPERAGDRVYNSAVFTDGRGAPTVYRKSHLYGAYERAIFAAGEPTTVTAQLGDLRIGMLICYDVEFPENVRRLALDGAGLVAVLTALPEVPEAAIITERMIPVRAFENQIFVAYANFSGRDELFAYAGRSHIAAPDGSSLGRASATETGVIFAEIDPPKYAASREINSYLHDLRR